MAIPDRIQRYLHARGVSSQALPHPATARIQRAARLAGVDPEHMARGVLLTSPAGYRLAVLPSDRLLDFCRVESHLGEKVELAAPADARRLFADCTPRTTPSLGPAYGLRTLVDADLDRAKQVFLAAGRDDLLLRVDAVGFRRLFIDCERAAISAACSAPVEEAADRRAQREAEFMPDPRTRDCLERLYALPALPRVASALLELRNDPNATPARLAELVAVDPSLSAQILRYARSAYFGYRGEVKDLTDAIHRVLGFDLVLNIALGLAAGRTFNNPEGGPLGLRAFWRHSAMAASLCRSLAQAMPREQRPNPGIAYLAGLLHDFGILVLGHLFRPEFTMLNRLAAAHPGVPVVALEQRLMSMGEARHVVGMGHARLGAWLMRRWELPEELEITLAQHHNPDYEGPHAAYPLLVLLSNHLIEQLAPPPGMEPGRLPTELMERLAISEQAVARVLERARDNREDIEASVRPPAA